MRRTFTNHACIAKSDTRWVESRRHVHQYRLDAGTFYAQHYPGGYSRIQFQANDSGKSDAARVGALECSQDRLVLTAIVEN
jgi:hypothetical protein